MLTVQPPLQGDDALLRLAQVRFTETSLGGELYPGSPDHLVALRAFRPQGMVCTAHLPRNINLLEVAGQALVSEYARCAAGDLYGILVHDHKGFQRDPDATLEAFREADRRLSAIPGAPLLFVEFAAGLAPEFFASLFERTVSLRYVCAAVDVSHVGIHLCQKWYQTDYPGEDVCALRPTSAKLPERIGAVQAVVAAVPPAVVDLVRRLARLHKPLHLHLHDGHPLSTLSEFGVSDHLSFLQQIRLPFSYRGKHTLDGMFGVSGLRSVLQAARAVLAPEKLSCMLEVHPQEGRAPLREHAYLFTHWQDTYYAERMNYWLDRLLENAILVRDAWGHC